MISKLYDDFEKEKEKLKSAKEQEFEDEKERLLSARRSEDKQIMKNALLKAKTGSVRAAAELAKTRILDMDSADYSQLLKKLYEKTGAAGEISLNERDLGRVDKSVFVGSKISDKPAKIDGGFIMDCGKTVYDCTLGSMFEERYGEICDAVNKIYMEHNNEC